ncbi:class I adenylate-forming enzyme family protein [Ensifer soli]|uniref:class I adenylate-forming enzyme family protein n=1 Tax=Ciceribacter sp. sgz301302 TaxID=3342379 RepID=UPI0035BB59C2
MDRPEPLNDYLPLVKERVRSVEERPLPGSLATLVDDAATEAGGRTVWHFIETGERETYDGLRRRTNGLAAALAAHGIGKGRHVAVMLPNVPAFPLTWLSLARIGAVMVPVNVGYKERELAYILKDSGAEYIILHADHLPTLAGAMADHDVSIRPDRIIVYGGDTAGAATWEALAAAPRESFTPAEPVGGDDLMNIQYTSGTTGFPKGCMLTQDYWIVSGYSNAFRDGKRYENLLASTPFYYMDPQWILLMTILQRGTLHVARRQSTSRFLDWLRIYEINFCLFPWVLHKQPPAASDRDNRIVRANVYGVPKTLHAEIQARFGLTAREAFGMTELGPTLFMPIEAADMVGSGSCGRPAPFRDCKLVDEAGRAVSVGDVGELVVRGTGILKGYYGNPAATAEAFFGEWFRTGDLFTQNERGFFTIIGRRKDMVRRSGENIAARELESVLNSFPEVSESAIVGVPDAMRGEEVKAWIVLKPDIDRDDRLVSLLIDRCRANLADFKVPRFFAFRDAFPRTGSSKIAKHILVQETADAQTATYDRTLGTWIG